jgi:hypothetical protein
MSIPVALKESSAISESRCFLYLFVVASFLAENRFPLFRTML